MKIIRGRDKKSGNAAENTNNCTSSTRDTSSTKDANSKARLSNSSILKESLEENLKAFKQFVGQTHDINIRNIKLSVGNGIDSALLFIEGLVDKDAINNGIIRELLLPGLLKDTLEAVKQEILLNMITEKMITHAKVEQSGLWTYILDQMFSGDTILLVDGLNSAIIIGTQKWVDRGVETPTNEQVIRGPRDSFTETLLTNTMLIRRRIKSQKLQFEKMKIGSLTKTDVIIAYIDGVANPKVLEEVRSRLKRIETDGILETNMIEEFIEDSPFSPMPQIIHTERPDNAAAQLLGGRVAILVDGTPNVLIVPVVFWNYLISPEDYYQRAYTSLSIRLLRIVALLVALCLPSFYIAITSFHQELIPVGILNIIIAGRRNIPFPILLEVLLMDFILEVIREAGVRLPQNVGPAISIVGALVLGQAAIQAKIASPGTVTVVAITAIANFTIPYFTLALSIRFLRFAMIIISGTLGIFGFLTALYVFLIHLCSLRSFGEPYMAPYAPAIPADYKDSLFRLPIWAMSTRPKSTGAQDVARQKRGLKPGPKQK